MKRRSFLLWSVSLVVSLLLPAFCGGVLAALEPSQPDFPNSKLLVSAASLQSSIGEKDLVIIDARPSGYATAHIPGAINLKYEDYFSWGTGLLPVGELNAKLSAAGLKRGMTFVIYDNTSASWGAAGRIFWMLEYLGCKKVHILDGGWDKWVADGRPTETTVNVLPPNTFEAVMKTSARSDKAYIAAKLNDNDFVVIDTRTDEEYLGWQLYGEPRGGHIPGAVQVPYTWLFRTDKTLKGYGYFNTLFRSRGITKDKEITAYCTVGIRSGFAYFILRLTGFPRVSNYDASIIEWSADETLPMERAPRFSTIVHPSWVKALIDYHAPGSTTAAPPEYPYARDHKYLIIQTWWGEVDDDPDYKKGHIPGAIHVGTGTFENGYPKWYILPAADIQTAMGKNGITADTTVIVYSDAVYDEHGDAWGVGWAARLWWIFKYAGLDDVRILNGGYKQWLASGYAGETQINYPVPTSFSATVRPGFVATTSYVFNRYKKKLPMYLGDVRKYDEYIGATSGYDTHLEARGRLPRATWLSDAGSSSLVYHDADGTISSYTEVRDLWKSRGIKSSATENKFRKPLVFYCGAGYRSALAFLYAYLMGYDNIRNYESGWFDWSTVFTEDASCTDGLTPGWCQKPSGRPIIVESPFE